MPTYSIDGPDGKTYSIEGPEGATRDQVIAKIKEKQAPPSGFNLRESEAAFEGGLLGGIPIVGPAIKGGAERVAAGLRSITGGGSYGEELKNVQKIAGDVEQKHPVAETAGEVVGGVTSMGAVGATATGARALGLTGNSLAQIMLKSAGSGAVISGADALVRGDNPEIAAGVGGVVGGVAPGLGRLASIPISRVASTVRGIYDPAAEAMRRTTSALARDIGAGTHGLGPGEARSAQQAGMPVNVMDLGGDTTRALGRSAANTSPEGRGILERGVNQRFESQADRLTGWLQRTFHFPNAAAQQEAIEQAGKTANSAAYKKAFEEGSAGIWNPELEQLAGSDAVAAAMKRAASAAKDEAIVSGHGAMNPRVTFTQDGRIQFAKGPSGVPVYPDLQFWDLTRRELSDAAAKASREAPSEGRRLTAFAKAMNAALDKAVPSYAEARSGAARFFGAENALEAGQEAVTSKLNNDQMRAGLAQMSDLERRLFQDGFVDRFVAQIRESPDRRSIVNQIAASPAARERLVIALGQQHADELEAMLRIEGVMDLARSAVQGGSTTVRQLTELGLAGGVNFYEGGGSFSADPEALTKAALVYGAARGSRVIDERVAQEVARLLASNRIADVQRGIVQLVQNPAMMGAIRQFDAAVAAIAARGAAPPVTRDIEGASAAALRQGAQSPLAQTGP